MSWNDPPSYPEYIARQKYYTPQRNAVPGVQAPVFIELTNISNAVIATGVNCPNCRIGVLNAQFSCCGILCCFLFFPIGFICCLRMRNKVCSNCKTLF